MAVETSSASNSHDNQTILARGQLSAGEEPSADLDIDLNDQPIELSSLEARTIKEQR